MPSINHAVALDRLAFFGTLLTLGSPDRITSWAIGCAAVSAVAFICAALLTTFLAASAHPTSAAILGELYRESGPRLLAVLTLLIGLSALMAAIGLSRWIRSKTLGIVTSAASVLGFVLALWILTGF